MKKLKVYGITGKNLPWFFFFSCVGTNAPPSGDNAGNFPNRTQYIEIDENSKTDLKYVTCGVPQGSINGLLLFLVYINDLLNPFRLLDPIIFDDDTNLFFNHKDIKHLFTAVNNKLHQRLAHYKQAILKCGRNKILILS